jgi:hypothetical protein
MRRDAVALRRALALAPAAWRPAGRTASDCVARGVLAELAELAGSRP